MCGEGIQTTQLKGLHNLFTLPEQNLSLPHMAFMYSANDFRVLLDKSKDDKLYEFENNNFSILLEDCLRNVSLEKFNADVKVSLAGEEIEPFKYLETSPCFNTSLFPQCSGPGIDSKGNYQY